MLTIEDNGVGFDPAGVVKLGHQGLANIYGRAAKLGGTVTIESQPGSGTRVVVRVPIEPDSQIEPTKVPEPESPSRPA